jgi:hypothetical protein
MPVCKALDTWLLLPLGISSHSVHGIGKPPVRFVGRISLDPTKQPTPHQASNASAATLATLLLRGLRGALKRAVDAEPHASQALLPRELLQPLLLLLAEGVQQAGPAGMAAAVPGAAGSGLLAVGEEAGRVVLQCLQGVAGLAGGQAGVTECTWPVCCDDRMVSPLLAMEYHQVQSHCSWAVQH